MRARARWVVLFGALAGCSVAIPDGRLRCEGDVDCPPGYDCRDRLCWAPGNDAGTGDAPEEAEEPIAVACGGRHTCALTDLGRVYCWGDDTQGQVGDDALADATPITDAVPVAGLPEGVTIEAIAVGASFSCALDEGSAVYCWGDNGAGQLGDPSVAGMAPSPNRVMLGAAVVPMHLTVGGSHACVLDDGGRLHCWGSNASGQLGDGTTTGRPTPVEPQPSRRFRSVSAGTSHTCALDSAGGLSCWGSNWAMQLGTDDDPPGTAPLSSSSTPIIVALPDGNVDALEAMDHHNCVLIDGSPHCWGWNGTRQLGALSPDRIATPTEITLGGSVRRIAGGGELGIPSGGHTCALLQDTGSLTCWGANSHGQLGRGASSLAPSELPTLVASLSGVTDVSAGYFHTCAIAAGAAYCWGGNGEGRLGLGTETDVAAPMRVRMLPMR